VQNRNFALRRAQTITLYAKNKSITINAEHKSITVNTNSKSFTPSLLRPIWVSSIDKKYLWVYVVFEDGLFNLFARKLKKIKKNGTFSKNLSFFRMAVFERFQKVKLFEN
jgi:hypothetical protein